MPRPRKLPDGLWKRGDTYYARFRANGRLVRKKLSSNYNVACDLLTELKARANRADFDLLDNDYSWDELKAEFLRWARQSVRNHPEYTSDLAQFEKYSRVRSVRQIDHAYVLGFREWRIAHGCTPRTKPTKEGEKPKSAPRREITPRTINRQVGTLNNMLNKAVEWKRIGGNPLVGLKPLRHDKPKKQRRALTISEVESIFEESPAYLRPVWRMFMTTGIRRDELQSLTFKDIDFERRVVAISAENAKNHKAREIPLDDEMFATIKTLRDEAPNRQRVERKTLDGKLSRDHVFVTGANTPWRHNLLRAFYAICKRAGIDDAIPGGSVDIHSLRVTFTTLALEHGAAPKAIQAILGHATLGMTMSVYAKATERAKRDAVAALPFASVKTPDHIRVAQTA